jgi:benzoyl-CoA reductase/2-hydroxyglutaryl-CoA dehydratase subunit BcrC/BadD/HgdB
VKRIWTLPRRSEVIPAYKEGGGLVAAVFPIHYPRSLFRAFDILPVEVWGPPRIDTSYGVAHVQPYVCSIVHNALSFLETGGLRETDVLVVPHACDSLQGLGSVLIDFVSPAQPVIPIYLPRGRRESDIGFLTHELRAVYRRLEVITGRAPTDMDLLRSIEREETADRVLMRLHQNRRRLPLPNLAFYRLIRSREYLPAETFIDLGQEALEQVGDVIMKGLPILMSGIVPEPMQLLEAISEMGGLVAGDDFACCGRRLYPTGTSQDPFRRMAERILAAPPDPTRGSGIDERKDHLLRLAETSGAQGVVFYDVKFCEPELFDLPILRRELQATNIPSIAIEVDINDPLSHQSLTRIEALLEMIR